MEQTMKFEPNGFGKRLKTMLAVDTRRMLTTRLFYIMMGIALVIPVLVLVMTTMMDGSVSVNPSTGVETVVEGFDSVWQAIGSASGAGSGMDMSMTGMCNINLVFFMAAALVCIFAAEDFRSGYAKNLFAVRARKTDYVISKTLTGLAGCACMVLCYFIGTMLGGAIAGLPFALEGVTAGNIVMCVLSKALLMAVFVPIYLLMSVISKQKLWLSILLSLCVGMLLFNAVPMLSPLDSGVMNVVICLVGGALFSVGLGAVSNLVMKKQASFNGRRTGNKLPPPATAGAACEGPSFSFP